MVECSSSSSRAENNSLFFSSSSSSPLCSFIGEEEREDITILKKTTILLLFIVKGPVCVMLAQKLRFLLFWMQLDQTHKRTKVKKAIQRLRLDTQVRSNERDPKKRRRRIVQQQQQQQQLKQVFSRLSSSIFTP